jgi:hypothetical protein
MARLSEGQCDEFGVYNRLIRMAVNPKVDGSVHDDVSTLQDRTAVAEYRLDRLEKQTAESPKEKRKDLWDKLSGLTPIVSGVVLAIVGYYLNDSVNAAFRRQELKLSNVKEMQEQLATLQNPATSVKDVEVAALTLSAFGAPAVGPLVTALFVGDEVRRPAAEIALRAVGLSEPDAVCGPMIKILDNHTGRFSWLTHLTAIRLIGDLECPNAGSVLAEYRAVLQKVVSPETLPALAVIVADDPRPDATSARQLMDELERTSKILQAHRLRQ